MSQRESRFHTSGNVSLANVCFTTPSQHENTLLCPWITNILLLLPVQNEESSKPFQIVNRLVDIGFEFFEADLKP